MIKRLTFIGFAFFVLAAAPRAEAAPLLYDPADVYMIPTGSACTELSIAASCSSLEWTHTFTVPPGEVLVDPATLVISLSEDSIGTGGDGSEVYLVEAGTPLATVGSGNPNAIPAFNVFAFLDAGSLIVRLSAVAGPGGHRDFLFNSSSLTLTTETISAVPEPTSLLLLGGGLAGLVARYRRNRALPRLA